MTYLLILNEIFVVNYATLPLKDDIQRVHCRTFNSEGGGEGSMREERAEERGERRVVERREAETRVERDAWRARERERHVASE